MRGGPIPDCNEPPHHWDSTEAPREVDQWPPGIFPTAPARFQDSSECLRLLVPTVTHAALHRTRLRYGSASTVPEPAARALRARPAVNGLPLGNTRWLLATGLGGNGYRPYSPGPRSDRAGLAGRSQNAPRHHRTCRYCPWQSQGCFL